MKRRVALLLSCVVLTTLSVSPEVVQATNQRGLPKSTADVFTPTTINRQAVGGPPTGVHPGAGVRSEIDGKRTRTSTTYGIGDLLQAVMYPGSVNFQDATGAWQPIDNTLVPTALTGFAYQNKANRYRAYLPADIAAQAVRVQIGSSF